MRKDLDYDPDEYYRHVILPHLRTQEMDAGSELVELLKNGNTRVTNKALIEKYGQGKLVNARETVRAPHLLDEYRREKEVVSEPLSHETFADITGAPLPEWDRLLANALGVPAGREDADALHVAVQALLTAVFSREFSSPTKEVPLHGGRKRIDIVFANVARRGFFWWLHQNYSAAHVIVEVKNYTDDVGHPELDQLAGRFSPSRGQFGLLVSRSFRDIARFVASCRDTADDRRGFIVALDEDDLRELVRIRRQHDDDAMWALLKRRFDELVM